MVMSRKMRKVNELSYAVAALTAACLSVLWQAHPAQSCAGGRYGRYENWPSNNDWDELLMLITGKYGKNGWGWHQQNSYAYSSLGDYPSGALKYSSNPFDTSGSGLPSIGSSNSNGISNSGYDSGSQYNSGGGGGGNSGAISKLNTDKIREALNSFFKTKPKKPSKPSSGWSSGGGGGGGGSNIGSGGGGFVGESFIDSPGPGPPYSSHDDSPIGPGPPYNDNINIGPGPPYESNGWSDGGSGPGPSSSPFSGGPPSGGNDQSSWPGQQESRPHDYASSGSPQNSNYNSQSQSHTSNQLYNSNNEQNGNSNGGGGNQFQSDYDAFGGSRGDYRKKRRRQGRRHPFANSDEQPPKQRKTHYRRVPKTAGLPTRPVLMGVESNGKRPFKFPPYPGSSGGEGGGGGGARRGISRRNRRMGAPMALRRRMFNTKFGGYKVDHSRFRFG